MSVPDMVARRLPLAEKSRSPIIRYKPQTESRRYPFWEEHLWWWPRHSFAEACGLDAVSPGRRQKLQDYRIDSFSTVRPRVSLLCNWQAL